MGFHFLFPPFTFGLSLLILILETLYLKKNDKIYKNISNVLIKMLGLVFVLGTAAGIVTEFSLSSEAGSCMDCHPRCYSWLAAHADCGE